MPSLTLDPIRDTHCIDSAPNVNYGSNVTWFIYVSTGRGVDRARGLVSYDLSSLPPDVHITSASIELHAENATTHDIEFYVSDQDWVESEATWNIYSTGNSWAGGTGDPEATPTFVYTPTSGAGVKTINNAALVDFVEYGLGRSNKVLNIVGISAHEDGSATTSLGIRSKEHGTDPPAKLTINYEFTTVEDEPLGIDVVQIDSTLKAEEYLADEPLGVEVVQVDSTLQADEYLADEPLEVEVVQLDSTLQADEYLDDEPLVVEVASVGSELKSDEYLDDDPLVIEVEQIDSTLYHENYIEDSILVVEVAQVDPTLQADEYLADEPLTIEVAPVDSSIQADEYLVDEPLVIEIAQIDNFTTEVAGIYDTPLAIEVVQLDSTLMFDAELEDEPTVIEVFSVDSTSVGSEYLEQDTLVIEVSTIQSDTDRVEHLLGYYIDRRTSGGPWVNVGYVLVGTNDFKDENVEYETLYTYRVLSHYTNGISGPSNEFEIMTPNAPPGGVGEGVISTQPIQVMGSGATNVCFFESTGVGTVHMGRMSSNLPNTNYNGSEGFIIVGRSSAGFRQMPIMELDLLSMGVPLGLSVGKVELEFSVLGFVNESDPGDDNLLLYLMYEDLVDNTSWDVNSATWNRKNSSSLWQMPGGDVIGDGPVSSLRVETKDGEKQIITGPGLSAQVQYAIEENTSRLLLVGVETAGLSNGTLTRWATNANSNPDLRPKLRVHYTSKEFIQDPVQMNKVPSAPPILRYEAAGVMRLDVNCTFKQWQLYDWVDGAWVLNPLHWGYVEINEGICTFTLPDLSSSGYQIDLYMGTL